MKIKIVLESVSLKTIKFCLLHYLVAYILGRLFARFANAAIDRLLNLFDIEILENLSFSLELVYIYSILILIALLHASITLALFSYKKNISFDMPLLIKISIVFCVVKIGIVTLGIYNFYPPQLLLLAIPLEFIITLFLVGKHVEKTGKLT